NHLDLDSKEVLEAALAKFPGTILFVSHDRYFINKIADKVVELTPNEAVIYLGDYDYYIEKKTETQEIEAFEKEHEVLEKTATERKVNFNEQKRIQSETRRLKREMSDNETTHVEREEELEKLKLRMTDLEIFQNHEKLVEIT